MVKKSHIFFLSSFIVKQGYEASRKLSKKKKMWKIIWNFLKKFLSCRRCKKWEQCVK
jgi:hypothetical protein